ncbi:MAG: hypothetical protein ABFD92_20220 [Planctomycetaceae bacterium]|nr:hypothetical protein [Planctomycetaceae bacterium]
MKCARTFILLLSGAFSASAIAAGPAAPSDAELKTAVNAAVKKGVHFLASRQIGGDFGREQFSPQPGHTAVCVLALIKSGVGPNDPVIRRSLAPLLKYAYAKDPKDKMAVYNCGLTLMALDAVWAAQGNKGLNPHYRAMANMVAALQGFQGGDGGWGYGPVDSHRDLSNTQIALLGLWSAQRNKVPVPAAVWDNARMYVSNLHQRDGGWVYSAGANEQRHSMVAAGISSLAICQLSLAATAGSNPNAKTYRSGGANLPKSGTVIVRRDVRANNANPIDLIKRGFAWFNAKGLATGELETYYLYGLERACTLTRVESLGGKEWYPQVAQTLIKAQAADGSWSGQHSSTVATCWALLALSRATAQTIGQYPSPLGGQYSPGAAPAGGDAGAPGADAINPNAVPVLPPTGPGRAQPGAAGESQPSSSQPADAGNPKRPAMP